MTDPRNETDPLPNGWTWEQAIEAACERLNAKIIGSGFGPYYHPFEDKENLGVCVISEILAEHTSKEQAGIFDCDACNGNGYIDKTPYLHANDPDGDIEDCRTCGGSGFIRDALAKARAEK